MCGIGEVEFFEAENGKLALDIVRNEWIDLVLSDINMPVMDGLEMIKILGEEGSLKNIQVIVITSDKQETTKKTINDRNVVDILYKPFKPEDLRQLLIKIFNLEMDNDQYANTEGLDF
jgi:two-component system chemotaxis response regulator CheY